jgi:hypothetical protein
VTLADAPVTAGAVFRNGTRVARVTFAAPVTYSVKMNFRFLALVLSLAVVALATGCGGSKSRSHRLTAGQRIIFKPGALAVGSPVSCTSQDRHIVIRVPSAGHSAGGASDFGGHPALISLETRRNGSVLAVCSQG